MPIEPSTLANPAAEHYDPALLTERAASVGHLFRERVAATPDKLAFMYPTVDADGDTWHNVTWGQAKERVDNLAAGLIALGVQGEQRVGLASGTRYEWALADLATTCAGAATTTIYPTTITEDVAFIIGDADCKVVFAENADQVAKLMSIRNQVPGVAKVIVLEGDAEGDWLISLADVEALGAELLSHNPGAVDARIDAMHPNQLATLIYTSGTTGRPKGVRLLHRTWTYQAATTQAIDILHEDDLQYLWLPLAHVFGKQLLTINVQIGFATAIDGRIDKIVENLTVVKPTFMAAVPRIFEKVYARIMMTVEAEGGIKLKLFTWAVGVGGKVAALAEQGKKPSGMLARQYAVADKLVLSTVRQRFGGRLRFFVSGSAALNQDINRWFASVGLLIAEGYGLTESGSGAFVNRIKAHQVGTVGWPLPGLEHRFADDGELLIRGDGIMDGYHNNPEATAEALDDDGWFHTGDIGEVDSRGFLRITDRKKDLFKTSNGKYVAPSAIESTFKGICPWVSQLVVHGNGRNFVSALVTLDADAIPAWAAANGMAGKPYAEVVSSPEAHAMMQGYIDQLNATLNRWESIKRFTILDHDLTVEAGELTPSMKLKRKVVSDKFQDLLDAHYTG
ncbi:MAG: long-chain fatty acid--CoA ligase [Nostocoides sp.]